MPSERKSIRLDCAGLSIELASDDAAVVDFVAEYFNPWFQPTERPAEWLITVSGSAPAYREMQERVPADAEPQPCFAHDQSVLSLPASRSGGSLVVRDAQRSCYLRIRPRQVDLVADATTRRWRFTLLWIFQEIAATCLRQTHVDVHAAALEYAGRALLVAGPKNAGKTTLAFYLMRSLRWGSIANDRTFVGGAPAIAAAGMPTAVRIRPATLARFPELSRGLESVARPYLHSLAELETADPNEEPVDAVGFFALTPNQIALRLGTHARAAAELRAIVFPQISDDVPTWTIEPMPPDEVAAGIHANLYGAATGERPATVFEELGGGQHHAPPELIAAVAANVAGYRVLLGRNAYSDATLAERLTHLPAA